jgi:hypothetical protein
MWDFITEAFLDTLKTIPFLLVAYLIIEYFESRFGHSFKHKLQNVSQWGPIIGSLLGAIPQCGFSVFVTSLYLSGYASLGTLISVYIATSDEALPILLAHPEKIKFIFPLILFKVIYAAIIGLIIDQIVSKNVNKQKQINTDLECCGHHKSFSFHPLIHTAKLSLYILGFNLLLGLILRYYHSDNFFNPISSALIGLIPNCAASVFLTQLFLKNSISFGTLFAGLSSSAGLGLLLLFKENKNYRHSFEILILLYILSVLGGYMIQNII